MPASTRTKTSPILRALFHHWVDYAGKFPPASLPLAQTVGAYNRYAASREAWMLGRLVLPAADLPAAEQLVASQAAPVPVSLVGTADELAAALPTRRLGSNSQLRIVSLETRWAPDKLATLGALTQAVHPVYVEIPAADVEATTLQAIQQAGCYAKLRTGGVRAEAIPSAATLATFMAVCHALGLPYKLTAGLHHAFRGDYPLTYAPDSESAVMHGFVQVALAGLILQANPDHRELAEAVLEEADRHTMSWSDDEIRWRNHAFAPLACRRFRKNALQAVGSCSFDEPVAELSSWC